MVDSININALLGSGGSTPQPLATDLVTGGGSASTGALLSRAYAPQTAKLTPSQDESLQNIREFIDENVEGPAAEKLLNDLAGVEALYRIAAEQRRGTDPIFSLLSGSSLASNGSLIDLFA